jgi:two-component system chemotaxis response regulator CheY
MLVYLIDDDAQHRSVVGRLMREFGLRVVGEAGDGREALRALDGVRPDLIVTDCQMPQMDGISFARALRATGNDTPLIMLSGQHCEEVVSAAIDAGVNCFVAKPVDPRLLADAIRMVLPAAA